MTSGTGVSITWNPKLVSLVSLIVLVLGVATTAGAASPAKTNGPFLGEPFIVASSPNDLTNPTVAYDPHRSRFLVVYENQGVINAQCLAPDGATVATYVVGDGVHPDVAYNSATDEYLVVWQHWNGQNDDIQGARIGGICWPGPGGAGVPFDISTRPWHQRRPAVAFNQHSNYEDYLVVWEDIDPSWVPQHWWIWAQRVAASSGGGDFGGELIGANFDVTTTGYNTEPDVAHNLNMNEYLVAFTREPIGGGPTDVYGALVTRDGVVRLEKPVDTSGNNQDSPAVAALRLNHSTPYLVVFRDYWNDPAGDVRGYLVDKQGNSMQLLNIATDPGREEWVPDIASSEAQSGYTVVWAQMEDDWNIYGRRVWDDGTTQPPFDISRFGLVVVPCHEEAPAVAGGSPLALTVWQDNCLGGSGPWKIAGRLLGNRRVYLPLVVR